MSLDKEILSKIADTLTYKTNNNNRDERVDFMVKTGIMNINGSANTLLYVHANHISDARPRVIQEDPDKRNPNVEIIFGINHNNDVSIKACVNGMESENRQILKALTKKKFAYILNLRKKLIGYL
jgi:hypothetical protein